MKSRRLLEGASALAMAMYVAAPQAMAQDRNAFDFGVPVQTPFVCENTNHGVKLEPITAEPCQAAAVLHYIYKTKEGAYKPFDQANRPTDIAETTTNKGVLTPIIVRQEIGKSPNGQTYVISVLHDPAAGNTPTGRDTLPAWNGKLIMAYGGGVQPNYHSGRGCGLNMNLGFVGDGGGQGYQDIFIERGYATACGSLMVMGTNNDDVKSAESTAQIKARFAEMYGAPDFTIGQGASGGSMQQLLIAENYPGLLDGILPKRDYPDGITFLQPLDDCELLVNFSKKTSMRFTENQLTKIAGYATFDYCRRNGGRYPNLRPSNCDNAVKDEITFANLADVRCTYTDNMNYVYGLKEIPGAQDAMGKPASKAAPSIYDNVGIQYGLRAFNDGVITFEQFVELNRNIGGMDINGKPVADRSVGDETAIRLAYETGRVVRGGAGLATIPIIDIRRWRDIPLPLDNPTDLDVHDASHSRAIRERLIKANGNADNMVIITTADSSNRNAGTPIANALARALAQMDEWLVNIQSDPRDIPMAQKVAENKPEDLVDSCYVTPTLKVTDAATCAAMFPYSDRPRIVAGGPLTEDVLKCQLKPVSAADYTRPLSADQLNTIGQVFPAGVCDYSKPGVGDVPLAGVWLSYTGNSTYKVSAN